MILSPTLAIHLALRRDSGTKIGGKIKGKFSVSVKDAGGVERVEFYLNGELVEAVEQGPFKWSFKTGDYPDGNYSIRAVAFLKDGTKEEDGITVQFVTNFGWWWPLYLTGMLLFVAFSVLAALWQTNKERKAPAGKTKCPRCGTVFERKWSAFHKGSAYRNTCPICGETFWAKRLEEEG